MSDPETSTSDLFSEFEPTSTEDWENVLTRDLKGADYKKKLKWDSIEGIEVLPFYRKEDLENLPHLADGVEIETPAEWEFCEVIDRAAPSEANKEAKRAVESGADSLWLTIQIDPDEGILGGDISGTHVQNLDDLKTLLDGIDLEKTGVVFNSGAGSVGLIGLLKAFLQDSDAIPPSFLFDPFTYMAGHGRLPLPEDKMNSIIGQMVDESGFRTLAADGAFYHNCGATIIQELGIALSIGSEFLARVPDNKREQAAKQFWMHLSAGSLYFPEIAKFRAARLLWMRVLDAYDIDSNIPLTIHASTSTWNKAIADPHNNMLRATTEATSAAVGGANRITVHPYNVHFEETDEFSRRIARNVSHILNEEAHVSAVENPGDGSYYVEVLTDEIAKKAWEVFKLIEKQGGFQKALEGKIIQGEVGRSRKMKEQALATRELVMTGVNHYPDAGQDLPLDLYQSTPVDSLHQSDAEPEIDSDQIIESLSNAFSEQATIGDVVNSFLTPQKQLYPALKTYRAAKPFEEMRLRTQQIAESRGQKIKAQLIPVGNKKMRKARATFSQNYLECAGFYVDSHPGFDSIKDAVNETGFDNADIYVLCGSDDEYPDLIPEFCSEFGDDSILVLAGYPKDNIDEFKKAGIDFFIYSGSNMLDTLGEIQEKVV
ncbi:methylmalonyl-CoA mutase family protein [Rhodohalobacter sp. 8-1]|uniref:methylmalonyl-CoA mutase family protein n=1 Tax=Rhodohalobacter sp. 8-1 TaxID=3131972 RepID=UPI0030EF6972